MKTLGGTTTRITIGVTLILVLALLVPVQAAQAATARAGTLLGQLTVTTEVRTGYDRSLFPHWIDADGNGCDTRREVLIAESQVAVTRTGTCTVTAGRWYSLYDGVTATDPTTLDIDHMVPLAEAWDSGARQWDTARRRAFANDLAIPDALFAVTASVNRSKGDQDPAQWMPPRSAYRCDYVVAWIRVKHRWGLSVDSAERNALSQQVDSCGDPVVEVPPRA